MTTTLTRPMLQGTASMLGDPEAHRSGVASVSCPNLPPPCAGSGSLEWVPDVEQPVVPREQRQLCLQCPGRQWCLATAIETSSVGYWAGTTTAQRRALQRGGTADIAGADAQAAAAAPTHPVGQGSLRTYRRDRCRCPECKRSNAAAKVVERGRERSRVGDVGVAA